MLPLMPRLAIETGPSRGREQSRFAEMVEGRIMWSPSLVSLLGAVSLRRWESSGCVWARLKEWILSMSNLADAETEGSLSKSQLEVKV